MPNKLHQPLQQSKITHGDRLSNTTSEIAGSRPYNSGLSVSKVLKTKRKRWKRAKTRFQRNYTIFPEYKVTRHQKQQRPVAKSWLKAKLKPQVHQRWQVQPPKPKQHKG